MFMLPVESDAVVHSTHVVLKIKHASITRADTEVCRHCLCMCAYAQLSVCCTDHKTALLCTDIKAALQHTRHTDALWEHTIASIMS
jgi:hypothetical protein